MFHHKNSNTEQKRKNDNDHVDNDDVDSEHGQAGDEKGVNSCSIEYG